MKIIFLLNKSTFKLGTQSQNMAGRTSRESDQDVCLYLGINHAVQRKRFGGATLYNCRHGKRSRSPNKHTSLHPAVNSPGLFLPHFKLVVRLQTKPKYITARTGEFVFARGSVAVHGGGGDVTVMQRSSRCVLIQVCI